ncbi:hypothetical protein CCHR01_09244 [Colletotrichum chrysophilum]|uniref:Uncharacterized protein n=1 Tax=Colletotrichum chrysophilum TaxID=1836956 RepID=A0AAD9AHG9_9PEZI|nr:hypothetical protein CCHR01_09244 [Colletotrichum chrysophilum]
MNTPEARAEEDNCPLGSQTEHRPANGPVEQLDARDRESQRTSKRGRKASQPWHGAADASGRRGPFIVGRRKGKSRDAKQ